MALATFVYDDTPDTIEPERRLMYAPGPTGLPRGTPSGYFEMVDSAFPISNPPAADITLIYIGGDTPHPWTTAEVNAAAKRTPLLWPCWVRSNPSQVNATNDANACVSTLHAYGVPKGVNCILDLETAVNTGYVNTFNDILGKAGYPVAKYGSSGFIWQNPKTSGGTFVASPGATSPITIGDAVATQYRFAGNYDLSWVKDSVALWEAGDMPLTSTDLANIANAVGSHVVNSVGAITVNGVLRREDLANADFATRLSSIQAALAAIQKAQGQAVDPAAVASAVVADLAAQGLTADAIATHVLAGLPADMAAEVVAAMGAKLSAS